MLSWTLYKFLFASFAWICMSRYFLVSISLSLSSLLFCSSICEMCWSLSFLTYSIDFSIWACLFNESPMIWSLINSIFLSAMSPFSKDMFFFSANRGPNMSFSATWTVPCKDSNYFFWISLSWSFSCFCLTMTYFNTWCFSLSFSFSSKASLSALALLSNSCTFSCLFSSSLL